MSGRGLIAYQCIHNDILRVTKNKGEIKLMPAISNKEIVVLEEGSVTLPKGFTAGGMHCGIKRKRLDLGYIVSEVPAAVAGVYTTNIFQAAPLLVTQESIAKENRIQAVIVNSGNANACTGEQGLLDDWSAGQHAILYRNSCCRLLLLMKDMPLLDEPLQKDDFHKIYCINH